VSEANLVKGWGPDGFCRRGGETATFPRSLTRVSEANLVKGWGPDGFAGGAGKRRRFPGYQTRGLPPPAASTGEGAVDRGIVAPWRLQ
jgi:hypothetical protein